MKKITLVFAAVLIAVGSAYAQCISAPSGLIGWWPGQNNPNDIIGGNDARLMNGTGYTANGEVGAGFNLNGSNNYLLINPVSPSGLDVGSGGGLTFEMWINPASSTPGPGMSLAKYEKALGTSIGSDVSFQFFMDVNLLTATYSPGALGANLVDTANVGHVIAANNVLSVGVWQHVALTYDKVSGLCVLYANGVPVAQTNLGSFNVQTTYTNLLFGGQTTYGSVSSPVDVFAGQMDELSLYNRALSSNEVAAIYLAGSAGKCTPVPLAPIITQQPTNLTVLVSNTASFSVAATGTAPLTYQWSFSHTNIVGATNTTLVLPNVQLAQAGNYSVLVSNLAGFTNSVIAVLTVQTPTPPPPACDPPPSGIVAWWPGQNSANDIIGTNNGTFVGAVGYTSGEVGQAFVFNGYQQVVTVGNSSSLQLQDFTLEAWIKRSSASLVTAPGGYGCIFTYGADGYGLYLDNNGTPALSLIGTTATQPSVSITDTNFHHLAVTKSGSTVNFYIDGVAYSAPAFNQTFVFNTVAAIGGRGDNLDNSFLGAIDEVSVYNRALSSNEVAAIYLAGSTGKCTPVPLAPIITQQPTNLTVLVSNTASFSVAATGTAPLTYQWSFSHTNIVGATNTTLVLPNVQLAQAGNYSVLVSNLAGFTNSVIAVLTVQTPTPPPPACDPPPSGLVSWWPGQNNANDIIGGNNGTLVNGTTFTTGEVGSAFNLNGGNNYVLINPATPSSLDVGAAGGVTFEAWIKPNTVSSEELLLEYERTLGTSDGSDVGLCLAIHATGILIADLVGVTNGGNHFVNTPPGFVTAGVWQHIALTYDQASGQGLLYINGVNVAATNWGSYTLQTSFTNILLGARTTYGSAADPVVTFSGAMDEPTIYNRALSSNEVAAIYLAGSAGKCTPVPLAPIITQQPTNLTVLVSNTASFSVAATGTAPLTYQWSFSHTNIVGATNTTLVLPNVQLAQAGNYSVLVSNLAGFTNSVIAVLTVQTPTPPPPACDPPPSGIVAWLPGQNNANDIIGGNNGTLINGAGFTTNGEVGSAFNLNGANNFVLVGASPSLSVGLQNGFTYEVWINPTTVSVNKTLFEYERVLGSYNGSDAGMAFAIHNTLLNGTPAPCLYANLTDTSNFSHELVSPANSVTAGQWQHVAVTYDKASGVAAIYTNGVAAIQTNLGSFTLQSSFTNVLLGARTLYNSVANPGDAFSGSMDEISFYDRALSSNEVAAIYLAGSAGKCTPVPLAPIITQQPTNLTVLVSNTASFSVAATGTAPLTYQWSFSHTNIVGATNTTLVLPNVQLAQAGNYSVLVSNLAGFTNSAVAVLTVQTPPPPACDPPPSGIVAWWPGQNSANDIIGTNNGTFVGAVGYTSGEVGQAFVFNGYQQLVNVGNPPSLQLQNFTIEAWLKRSSASLVTGPGGYGTIFTYGAGGYGLFLDNNGTPALSLIGTTATQPSVSITDTNFHHLAVTKSGSTVNFYIDGVAYSAPAFNYTFVFNTVAAIGGRGDNLDNGFLGAIDEVSVYNRALSSNEVAAIYLAGSAGKCTPVPLAPIITQQPTNLTVLVSNTASFSVAATGTAPLTYQWSFSHTNIVGATNTTLVLPNVQLAQAGNYSVLVSNLAGFTNSVIAVLTVQTPTPPPPACDPPPSGIVAWLPGQNNANDIIGGNNGTLINGAGFTTNGEVGSAFNLNGANNFVLVGASPSLSVGLQNGFTYEVWINPTTVSVNKTLFEYERVLGSYNGSDAGMAFAIHNTLLNGTPAPCLYANLTDTSNFSHELVSPANSVTAGQWQHVAVTYDKASGVAAIYTNGVAAIQTNLGSFTLQSSFTNVLLGARTLYNSVANPGDAFSGSMDEISFYDRALSSNEVAAIYLAGSAGKCTPVPLAPIITQQPTNLTVLVSNTASFSVAATGTAPLTYQWSFSHTNIVGATNTTLVLPNVQLAQAGNYSVLVSNLAGFTNSVIAVLTVQTPTPPPPACDPPPSGIVAWLPGQNNANDIIGGNNGTLINGAGFTTNGEVGSAFNLNGANNFVLVGASPSLSVGLQNGFTYEVWINPTTVSVNKTLFEYERVLGSYNGSDAGMAFAIHNTLLNGTPAPCLYANLTDTSNFSHELVSPANSVTAGQWQHVAVTYDKASGVAAIYTNGVAAIQTNLGSFTLQSSFTNVLLGARTLYNSVANPGDAFSGSMDEISIYNRALSSNEVAAIYLAGSAGKCFTQTPETVLSLAATNAMSGSTITMPVLMNATGLENTFLATVGYDPTKLVLQNVQLGQATAGAYLQEVDYRTNAGLVGFAILLNSGSTMPAGTNQQVALLNFQALPVTSNTTVSLFFTNSPTLQQTYDNNFDLLPTLYAGATVTVLPAEYEADVYPRTNGDHTVTVQDWLEEGRMVAGLDIPANSDEFHRADCAPRGMPDGVLTVADWVQAGRYALGLDPLTLVTLPPAPHAESHGSQTPTRTLEIGTISVPRGQTVNVPVLLVCTANENAAGMTVSFDPNQLQVTGVTLGSAMTGGRTNINYSQPGKLGIVVAMPPGASLPSGTNQLLVLQITASPNASGVANLTLDNSLVQLQIVDNTANALTANYVSGAVILPPQPTIGTAITGGGLQLTWPTANGTFQVQSASTPAGPWANVSASLITNGANVTVTVTATNQQQYFRLVGQ